jgi:CRP-like cAMP-binding protein
VSASGQELFRVWDKDNTVYGPVGLSTLIQWVHENRVLSETFIQSESENRWHRAENFAPLQKHLASKQNWTPAATRLDRSVEIDPEELRQFAVFSGLTDEQLKQFAALGDSFEVPPEKLIVRQGDPCDAIYFVLSGMLRVRLLIGVAKDDITLCKISGGEFFGEVGMFLQSTRTADVVSETEARLLRMSSNAFQLLVQQTPALAAPVLFALAVTMARRMAEDNQRFAREKTAEFLWR